MVKHNDTTKQTISKNNKMINKLNKEVYKNDNIKVYKK